MIVGIVLVLVLIASIAFFSWQIQIEHTQALQAAIQIEQIRTPALFSASGMAWAMRSGRLKSTGYAISWVSASATRACGISKSARKIDHYSLIIVN